MSRKVAALALVAAFGLFLTWSLGVPRYGGPDEPAHVLRAASVATGDVVGDRTPEFPPGYRTVTVPFRLTMGDPTCFRHDPEASPSCAIVTGTREASARAATSAGTYPPLYYAMVGVPVRVLGQQSEVVWYRIVAAAWCAAAIALALVRARQLPGGTAAVLCLPPAAWFLFGVVNPNSLEIALAVLAWVATAGLLAKPGASRADALWLSVPAALFVAIRPISVLTWLVMAVILAIEARTRLRRPLALFGPPAAAIALSIGWAWWSGTAVDDPRTARDLGLRRSLRTAIEGTTDTVREIVGSLGWLEFSAPNVAQLLWWMLVAWMAWHVLATSRGRSLRGPWLFTVGATLVIPVLFETAVATKVGFIWQGRYSIAMAMGAIVLAASALARRGVALVALVAVGAAELITFGYTLHRYRRAWEPPWPPWLLMALNAAAFACVSGLALRHLAADDVERRPAAEPVDLLVAEGVHAVEIDR